MQTLRQSSSNIDALLERARQIEAINRSLTHWCNEPWIAQIRLANLRGDTLVIYAESATALAALRHRSRSLIDWINRQHQLQILRVETKIRPR